jgi:hypothetical protein
MDAGSKREVVIQLLRGGAPAAPPPGAAAGLAAPLGADLLDAVGQDLDGVRATFASAPDDIEARFRSFFHDNEITHDEIGAWIDVWHLAAHDPETFYDHAVAPVGAPPPGAAAGLLTWFGHLRAYLHEPAPTSDDQQAQLTALAARYHLASTDDIQPNIRKFETWDPAWVLLAVAKLKEEEHTWPNLAPFREHGPGRSFVYDYTSLAYGAHGLPIALFADFGTGYAHSRRIAQQLADARYPLAFHLGDVYYAGRPDEFAENYTAPLAMVTEHTVLFSMPENHELYSGGQSWCRYVDDLRAAGRTPQEASYFCVRLQHHQIVAIDVNWQGRQTFRYAPTRAWLAEQLAYGRAHGLVTILLTGSAPYCYGEAGSRPLADDLSEFVDDGTVSLWFWGDDHYCALFPRDAARAPFIGSCIGHGGFPGKQRSVGETTRFEPAWLETEARLPAWTGLRQDVTDNGWCEATLLPDGNVGLCYVDWLASERCRATTVRAADGHLELGPVLPVFGRGAETFVPTLHVTRAG